MKETPSRSRPDWTTAGLAAAALGLAGLAWSQGGPGLALEGLIRGAETLRSVSLLLVAAFVVAGMTQVLISRESIERWLGTRSGWRGILLACLGGALIPGGPYVYYPIAGALLASGAGLGPLIAFVTAKNLWSVTRLPLEFALLGPQLTIMRFALTLVVPPLLGMLTHWLFGWALSRVRRGVTA
jgi:uncharacterized membrane protein YraQ (UPF0718 family)